MRVEISEELTNLVRDIAEAEGRSVSEVLEEAVVRYLDTGGASRGERLSDVDVAAWVSDRPEGTEGRPRDGFLALLDRMASRFDLEEGEAMRIAVEEQHASRRDRAESERAER